MEIQPLKLEHWPAVVECSNRNIGDNYYSLADIQGMKHKIFLDKHQTASFVLVDKENVLGLRLTYWPQTWLSDKDIRLWFKPQWGVDESHIAYFQTIFVDSAVRGGGWGGALSLKSLEVLRAHGVKAVLCHSWKESPGDSSRRYLEKMGFKALGEIPNFWINEDYQCVRCGKSCYCTAIEMILYL